MQEAKDANLMLRIIIASVDIPISNFLSLVAINAKLN